MRIVAILAFAVALIGLAAPASALPIAKTPALGTTTQADAVAWYCNARGHCVQAVRPGYVFRPGWAPSCGPGWRWNGYRCVPRCGYGWRWNGYRCVPRCGAGWRWNGNRCVRR